MVQESGVIGISEVSAVGEKDRVPLQSPPQDLIAGEGSSVGDNYRFVLLP